MSFLALGAKTENQYRSRATAMLHVKLKLR